MTQELELRYKLLFIPYHLVLESVEFCIIGSSGWAKRGSTVDQLAWIFDEIPHDTEIRHVKIPFNRRGFLFTLYHKSFNLVLDSEEIPEIEWHSVLQPTPEPTPEPKAIPAPDVDAEAMKSRLNDYFALHVRGKL